MRRLRFLLALLLPLLGPSSLAAAEPLVDAAWLRANLGRPDLAVLDIRGPATKTDRAAYEAGHVPGAVYSDYGRDGWRVTRDAVPGMLPTVAALERLIGGLGIDGRSHVVIVAGGVSAADMASATRVYWTFKVLGHDAVSILDGGHRAYTADPGAVLESGGAVPRPRVFEAAPRWDLVAGRADVVAALDDPGVALADIRPPAFYRGEVKSRAVARAGTIPGAASLPEGSLVGADGRFVSAKAAGPLLTAAGLDQSAALITFCNTGHWASLGWFVRSEILGQARTRLYDGSLADWAAQDQLPVVPGGS